MQRRQYYLYVQDGDADLRELLHMLQGEESCSDEEGDGHSRLMELAAAVASQPNAHARLSEALSQMVRLPPLNFVPLAVYQKQQ